MINGNEKKRCLIDQDPDMESVAGSIQKINSSILKNEDNYFDGKNNINNNINEKLPFDI
jgi:hypothetical protein